MIFFCRKSFNHHSASHSARLWCPYRGLQLQPCLLLSLTSYPTTPCLPHSTPSLWTPCWFSLLTTPVVHLSLYFAFTFAILLTLNFSLDFHVSLPSDLYSDGIFLERTSLIENSTLPFFSFYTVLFFLIALIMGWHMIFLIFLLSNTHIYWP